MVCIYFIHELLVTFLKHFVSRTHMHACTHTHALPPASVHYLTLSYSIIEHQVSLFFPSVLIIHLFLQSTFPCSNLFIHTYMTYTYMQ